MNVIKTPQFYKVYGKAIGYILANLKVFTSLRVFFILLMSVIGITALYSVYWVIIANHIESNLLSWLRNELGSNLDVNFERARIHGYPTTFSITLNYPSLRALNHEKPQKSLFWQWHGKKIVSVLRPWNFGRLHLDIVGSHRLVIPTREGQLILTGTAKRLSLDIELEGDFIPASFNLKSKFLTILNGEGQKSIRFGNIGIYAVRSSEIDFSKFDQKDSLQIILNQITVNPGNVLPFGGNIDRIGASLSFDKVPNPPFNIAKLRNWRNRGGVLEIISLTMGYGPFHGQANGTVALDEEMQIQAALSLEINGFSQAITELLEKRFIKPETAILMNFAVSVLGRNIENSDRLSVRLPLTLQGGKFKVYNLNLLDVPRINW